MARMLGKALRVRGCEYGCCVPDRIGRHPERIRRVTRAREKARWKRDNKLDLSHKLG